MSDWFTDLAHDGPTADEFYDGAELADLLGRIDQHVDGDEVVLTRISRNKSRPPYEVLRFDLSRHLLRIFPKSSRAKVFQNQFDKIVELQIEKPDWDPDNHSAEHGQQGLLYALNLPKGFSSIYEYGLGIKRDYADLLRSIETHTKCTSIRFITSDQEGPSADGTIFRISLKRFNSYCAAVDRSRQRGRTAVRRVIDADCHNATADLFDLNKVDPKYGTNPIIRALTEEVATGHVTNTADRSALADEVTLAAPAIAREAPQRLVRLRHDIELVSLESLIAKFESDLDGPHKDERHWQAFFEANHFALQLIFSTPIVVERYRATVQDADIDGQGARITDFLCANAVTRTSLLVEIKTPSATLMSSKVYRGKGNAAVYPPHLDLSGPVAQVQSQMAAVPQSLAQRLPRTPELDLDPWNDPRGAVITGRLSSLNPQQLESFLRYRADLSTVTVLGYDEVLERLKALHAALRVPSITNNETPNKERDSGD